jgi:hypothetical protein
MRVTVEVANLQQLHQERLLAHAHQLPDLIRGQGGQLDACDPLHGQHTPAFGQSMQQQLRLWQKQRAGLVFPRQRCLLLGLRRINTPLPNATVTVSPAPHTLS